MKTLNKTLTLIALTIALFLTNAAQAEETVMDHPVITYTNIIIENAESIIEDARPEAAALKERLEKEIDTLKLQVEHFIHHNGDVEFGHKTIAEKSVFNFSKLVDYVEINEFDETCNAIIDYTDMSKYTCVEL